MSAIEILKIYLKEEEDGMFDCFENGFDITAKEEVAELREKLTNIIALRTSLAEFFSAIENEEYDEEEEEEDENEDEDELELKDGIQRMLNRRIEKLELELSKLERELSKYNDKKNKVEKLKKAIKEIESMINDNQME